MRKQPAEVTPVEHQGIRYEAPHWGHMLQSEPSAAPSREVRMAQVLREKRLEGSDLTLHNPDDPDWIRAALSAAGFDAADIDSAIARRQVETVLGRVARAQMQTQMMRALQSGQGFGEGGPLAIMGLIDRSQIEADLATEGLNPDQVGLAMQSWDRQVESLQQAAAVIPPQNGGYVVARQISTLEKLWTVQVYQTEDNGLSRGSDIFITHLEIKDEHLLIVDETRRVHRLNLATRVVEQLPRQPFSEVEERDHETGGAYGLGDEALTSEEVLNQAMPGLLQRLDRAVEKLSEQKGPS